MAAAPAVMVDFGIRAHRCAVAASIFACNSPLQAGMPGMGGYWLCPAHGLADRVHQAGFAFESGKPWPQVGPRMCPAARADMTEKMVVPTWGSRLARAGVWLAVVSGCMVIGVTVRSLTWPFMARATGRGSGGHSGVRQTQTKLRR